MLGKVTDIGFENFITKKIDSIFGDDK